MRTLLGHPEPPRRGTVYTTTVTANPVDSTLIDIRSTGLFPVNQTSTATTRGWIALNR